MKLHLLVLVLLLPFVSISQNPVIEGDTMLCPNGSGTAAVVNDAAYESFAWYYKYWFSSDDFELIEGATGPQFTYDWETYDQALIKVIATIDGEEFESNVIQIDSWVFLPITFGYMEQEYVTTSPENGNAVLCAGASFIIEVFNPYSSNIKWYRDGVLIEGENQMTLEVTQAGVYHVTAAPEACPDMEASTQGTPIIVEIDEDCSLSVTNPSVQAFSFWPNPAKGVVNLNSAEAIEVVRIFDMSGKLIKNIRSSSQIDVSDIAPGLYLMEAETHRRKAIRKIVIE